MATVGTLAVNLIARTASFDKGVKKSATSIKEFSRHVNSSAAMLKTFAATAISVAGLGGIGYAVKSTLENVDALGKLSARIGVSTVALGGLGYAAGRSGSSVEAMNKSLEMMVRRIGEAQQGTGEAKKAIEAMGLNINTLASMRADDVFKLLADRINVLPTATAKATAAYQLFGRQGQQLLNLINNGSDGIDAYIQKFIALGGAFTNDGAKKVEIFNDTLDDLRIVLGSVVKDITIATVPAITAMLQKFIDNKDVIFENIKRYSRWAITVFAATKAAGLAVRAIQFLINAYKSLATAQALALAFSGPTGWAMLAAGVIAAGTAVYGVDKAFASISKSAYDVSVEVNQISSGINKATQSLAYQEEMQDNVTASVLETVDAYKSAAQYAQEAFSKKFSDSASFLTDKIAEYRDELKKLQIGEREYLQDKAMEVVRLDPKQQDMRLRQVRELMSLYDAVNALQAQQNNQSLDNVIQARVQNDFQTAGNFGLQGAYGMGLGSQSKQFERMNEKLSRIERYTQQLNQKAEAL